MKIKVMIRYRDRAIDVDELLREILTDAANSPDKLNDYVWINELKRKSPDGASETTADEAKYNAEEIFEEEPELDEDLKPEDWNEGGNENHGESYHADKNSADEFWERKKVLALEWAGEVLTHSKQTYYKLLGVNKGSSQADIRRAFRTASAENHPDRGGDVAMQAKLNRGIEVLGDPRLRKAYNFFLIQNRISYKNPPPPPPHTHTHTHTRGIQRCYKWVQP